MRHAWGLAFLLLAPRAAAAGITAGAPSEVPWLKDVNDFRQATVAVLADGSFAIAGVEFFDLAPQVTVELFRAQFFGPDGRPEGKPIDFVPGDLASDGGVGSLGDHYIFTWGGTTRRRSLAGAALYSRQGTPLAPPFSWPFSAIFDFPAYYRFGAAPTWRFLPLTYRQIGVNQDNIPLYQIALRVARPNGTFLDPPVDLAPQTYAWVEDAAINGDGKFVVVSRQCSKADPSLPCEQGMQIFDDPVVPRTPFLTASVAQDVGSDGTLNGGFRVAMDSQGAILLSWLRVHSHSVSQLVARLYDRQGAPLSEALPVAAASAPGPSPLINGLKALDDGNFVLSWLDYNPQDNVSSLSLSELETRTLSFGEPVTLATDQISGSHFALNGSGQGVVVWQTQTQAADGTITSRHGYLRVIRVAP